MSVRVRGGLSLAAVLVVAFATAAVAAPPFVEDDAEALYVLTGESAGDYYGWVAANIDDIDDDGVDDLAIPAILDPNGGAFAGRVYIHSGATGAVLNVIDGQPAELFGYSTAGAGDVNGDGTPDYVIGAPGFSSAPAPAGRVVVMSGADHSLIHELFPVEASFYGASVSGAGDVNFDGYADVLVGAPRADFTGVDAGRAYVYSGADGSLLWTFDGRTDGDLLGSAVGVVGDVNGDGASDVVVGAQGNGGAAYVLSGDRVRVLHHLRPRPGSGNNYAQFFASGAGDVDADGVPDVFVGDYNGGPGANFGTGAAYVYSGATGSPIHVIRAEQPGDGFGPGRGVGDVNDDGHADLIVASYTSSAGAPFAGRALVISGADGSTLRTITSTIANDNFGVDALGMGDADGDGFTDFVVTAVGQAFAGTGPGVVYVVKGSELP